MVTMRADTDVATGELIGTARSCQAATATPGPDRARRLGSTCGPSGAAVPTPAGLLSTP